MARKKVNRGVPTPRGLRSLRARFMNARYDADSKHFPTPQRPASRPTQVSAPTAGGWCSPEEAAAALASPPPPQETASSPPSSSPPEPLPPSAVDAVLSLMRCNPCEVLGSLSPAIGVDGRIALIGQINHSRRDPTCAVGMTKGGKRKDDGVGCGSGESLLEERHHGDGRETATRREARAGGGVAGFRCSVEVAWDKHEGGVFVKRFGMEPDERRPRWVCHKNHPGVLTTSFEVHVLLEELCRNSPRPVLDPHSRVH